MTVLVLVAAKQEVDQTCDVLVLFRVCHHQGCIPKVCVSDATVSSSGAARAAGCPCFACKANWILCYSSSSLLICVSNSFFDVVEYIDVVFAVVDYMDLIFSVIDYTDLTFSVIEYMVLVIWGHAYF